MALFRFLVLRFSSQRFSHISFGFKASIICFLLSSSLSIINSLRTNVIEGGPWIPHERTERTTSLVIFITITFFIASLPAGVTTLFEVIYPDEGFVFISSLVNHFSNLILTTNASIHCFICFAMSSDYRKTAMGILKKKETVVVSSVVF
uniref:G_PROTEIN_RECEP_F1_2 domain-containing protein n=1 Tax=Caenorhabditis tropicalis TaxID=1561998 RepID=A0A1I7V2L9_9PELO